MHGRKDEQRRTLQQLTETSPLELIFLTKFFVSMRIDCSDAMDVCTFADPTKYSLVQQKVLLGVDEQVVCAWARRRAMCTRFDAINLTRPPHDKILTTIIAQKLRTHSIAATPSCHRGFAYYSVLPNRRPCALLRLGRSKDACETTLTTKNNNRSFYVGRFETPSVLELKERLLAQNKIVPLEQQ